MSQVVLQSDPLNSPPSVGAIEYNGRALFFTPTGEQRGVVPGCQYIRLETALTGANATGVQSAFGSSCTLSSNTVYQFQSIINLIKTAGTTSHTVSTSFGGTLTINNIGYSVLSGENNSNWGGRANGANSANTAINVLTPVSLTAALTQAAQGIWLVINGTVSVNAGGTFIPQYSLSAAPGGAYSNQAGSFFSIWPVGEAGATIKVGTWT